MVRKPCNFDENPIFPVGNPINNSTETDKKPLTLSCSITSSSSALLITAMIASCSSGNRGWFDVEGVWYPRDPVLTLHPVLSLKTFLFDSEFFEWMLVFYAYMFSCFLFIVFILYFHSFGYWWKEYFWVNLGINSGDRRWFVEKVFFLVIELRTAVIARWIVIKEASEFFYL